MLYPTKTTFCGCRIWLEGLEAKSKASLIEYHAQHTQPLIVVDKNMPEKEPIDEDD